MRIDGIDVGGLDTKDARALIERRSAALAERPVVFTAAGHRFPIRPAAIGVVPNWKAAIGAAQRQGDGFAPWRGFKRLDVTFFGADVTPPVGVLENSLRFELDQIAAQVNRPPREAALVLHGRKVVVVEFSIVLIGHRYYAQPMLARSNARGEGELSTNA